jgi:hypothetical protein
MRKLALTICALSLAVPLGGSVWASGNSGDAPAPSEKDKTATTAPAQPVEPAQPAATAATPALAAELAELRALLKSQAAEIEAERRELAEMKAKIGSVKDEAVNAAVEAAVPAATAAISTPGSGYPLTAGGGADESPLAIHFKGVTLTPGGFSAAETVYRNRAMSADINSNFTAVPYSGSNMGHISEFNFSGRQSRLALKMDGKLGAETIGAYYEGDFLGAGTTSNDNESDSFVFRQRQAWGSIKSESGWYISGGQMWSLVTETKNGLENRTASGAENANTPLTIDAQYTAGFSWARQYGFRLTDRFFDKKFSLGFSVEGAQAKVTQHGANVNYVVQAPGSSGGLLNFVSNPTGTQAAANQIPAQNFTLNASPDFVFKSAWDPGWAHLELGGTLRVFRDRDFPCAVGVTAALPCLVNTTVVVNSAANASNNTRVGGFGFFNARAPIIHKKVDVGIHMLYGSGVGRYGTTGLADTTVRPTGTLAPIRGGQGLGTIEWHVTPRLDVYGYAGGEYDSRAYYLTAFNQNAPVPALAAGATSSTGVGYGSPTINNSGCTSPVGTNPVVEQLPPAAGLPLSSPPGSCTADPRGVIEGTIGFWHRLWQGDKGRIQWGAQYSYVSLLAWSGTNGVATAASPQFRPHTNDNMIFTSFRYYLP